MTKSKNIEINLTNGFSICKSEKPSVKGDQDYPFKIHIFPDFLQNHVIDQVRNDVNSSIKLKPKDNDLYKFKQSKDLRTEIQSNKLSSLLHGFIDVMLGEVRSHLENLTNVKLSDKNFDITASRYDVANYLLCHNDNMSDNLRQHSRAVAFVLYLNSRPWTEEDGGALILYESDSTGEPVKIRDKIYPKPNTLVVFPVSHTSWHSVEEVYCKDDFRLSINGWFHTDNIVNRSMESQKTIEPSPFKFIKPIPVDERIEEFFKEYFNQDYLMEKTCYMIKRKFKRKSEINLTNFLKKDKYKEICEALKTASQDEANSEHVGPYNKRNYRRLRVESLPQVCRNLYDAFQSELFFMLLSRFTGLDLQPPSLKVDEADSESVGDEENSEDSDESDLSLEDEEEDDEDDDDDDDEEDEDEGDSDEDESGLETENGKTLETNNPCQTDENAKKNSKIQSKSSSNDTKITDIIETAKRKVEEPTTSKGRSDDAKKPLKKRKKISDPLARIEFRHIQNGSYTLIHDHGFELGEKSALDVIFHFNHDFQVNFEDGGYISYIDGAPEEDLHDMDYELLTIEPKSNSLSLAYRCDEGTCRFLKYVLKSHKSDYHDLYCVYYEKPDDLPNIDSNSLSDVD